MDLLFKLEIIFDVNAFNGPLSLDSNLILKEQLLHLSASPLSFILFLAFLGHQESLNTDVHSLQDDSAVSDSSPPSLTHVVLQSPLLEPGLDRPLNSAPPPLYTAALPTDPPSAILLPRPQAVGSPGHPSPSLGLGNGDGSSSDSLSRQAIGQEDQVEEDEEEDDEDSSEYENLVSEQFQSPLLTETSLGRPATLWPDGDTHSSSGSSWSSHSTDEKGANGQS